MESHTIRVLFLTRNSRCDDAIPTAGAYSHGWRRGLPYSAAVPIPTAGAVGYRMPPLSLFPRLAPWATVCRRYRGCPYSHGWRRGLPYSAAVPIPTAGAVGYRISPLPRLPLFPRLAPWATVYRRYRGWPGLL
jgi:hypothetical protein